jgi:hypothetical protein
MEARAKEERKAYWVDHRVKYKLALMRMLTLR